MRIVLKNLNEGTAIKRDTVRNSFVAEREESELEVGGLAILIIKIKKNAE